MVSPLPICMSAGLNMIRQSVAAKRLHGVSFVEDRAQSLAGKSVDIEKMPWLHGDDFRFVLSFDARLGFERDASGLDLGASLVDFGLADDERRQKAHDIVAGLHREHALGSERLQQ